MAGRKRASELCDELLIQATRSYPNRFAESAYIKGR